MEQKEIIEGNKLIAEFMGAEKSFYGDYMIFTIDNPQYTGKINHSDIKYHTSWDWLMPVVEKIEENGCQIEIELYSCYVINSEKLLDEMNILFQAHCDSKIKAVYEVVVSYIRWYNPYLSQKDRVKGQRTNELKKLPHPTGRNSNTHAG